MFPVTQVFVLMTIKYKCLCIHNLVREIIKKNKKKM